MSASCVSFRSECDNEYAVDSRGSFQKINKQNRRPQYRRSNTPPGSVNGIHRRRSSRWTWGHGRASQSQNLRAFAGCIAAMVALCASAANAEVLLVGGTNVNFVTVEAAGNAANTNGRGAVGYDFNIQEMEVTNAQYVTFLNSVDPTGSNTLGLYNSSMTSSFRGGILNSGSTNGARYLSKNEFANRPVNFVSWNDAARFVNWVATSGTSTETGAYQMSSSTPNTRLAGAKFWLPSQDEWYKAAFYNPTSSSYNLYATGSSVNGSSPALTVGTLSGSSSVITNPSATTVVYANNGVAIGLTAAVGTSGGKSSFGAFDMNGNVWELTDTSGSAGQVLMYGGGYGQALSVLSATSVANNLSVSRSTYENQGVGFRIAAVAVPEPSTLVMLAGGASLFAVMWGKRRKSDLASAVSTAAAQE
jgi:sulfatase modifying factor 1